MTRALIVVGHGSHLNADSSEPVYAHAAAIRATGAFDEVHEAFWKEEPPLTTVFHLSDADEILIVPLFLSEGYFTREVLPREIGLSGPVMRRGHQTFHYLPPVGTHPAMTTMIRRRADRVLGADPERRKRTALAVIGHGTERNATSADTVYALVESLRTRGDFAAVVCGFLDEAPYIADVLDETEADEIVLVPFFVAEGWHTRETIPADLGLEGEATVRDGRTLWYTPPIGTLPEMVDVILEMASEVGEDLSEGESPGAGDLLAAGRQGIAVRGGDGGEPADDAPADGVSADGVSADRAAPGGAGVPHAGAARDIVLTHLREADGPVVLLDLLIEPLTDGRFAMRHVDDRSAAPSDLQLNSDPEDARDIARFRADGSYRAMRSTKDLRTGWHFPSLDSKGLWRALSLFYPVALDDWLRGRRGGLEPNHFTSWADRQTAMYAEVRKLEPAGVAEVAASLCASCHRSRRWQDNRTPTGEGPLSPAPPAEADQWLVVPCLEPCTMFATHARELVQKKPR